MRVCHCHQSSLYIRCEEFESCWMGAVTFGTPWGFPVGKGLLINCDSQWEGCKLKFRGHLSTINGYIFKFFMLSLYYLSMIPPQACSISLDSCKTCKTNTNSCVQIHRYNWFSEKFVWIVEDCVDSISGLYCFSFLSGVTHYTHTRANLGMSICLRHVDLILGATYPYFWPIY